MDISLDELSVQQAQPGALREAAPGSLALTQTAAYVFEQDGQTLLYGAIEYRNEGNAPLYLLEARLSFHGESGQSAAHSLQPTLAPHDVLAPGEYGYAAGWFPAGGFLPGEAVDLRAMLSAQSTRESAIVLRVDELFFADNYPGFSTLSGTLYNGSAQSCAMNMVYAGLYDKEDSFLGVWYFSKNAFLDSGDSVRFTTHLKAFPLDRLAERGAYGRCRAFGFN